MQSSPENTDNRNNHDVKRLIHGIFKIAYVPVRTSIFPSLPVSSLSELRTLSNYLFMLYLEAYRSSPPMAILFVLCHAWLSLGPAVSLYLAFHTLSILDHAGDVGRLPNNNGTSYAISAGCWLASASLFTFAHRKIDSLTICLAGNLRTRLLPRLAEASLRLDMQYAEALHHDTAFPALWAFGSSPEMDILRHFFTRMSDVLRVIIELPMVIWILCEVGDCASQLFSIIGIFVIGFSMFSPTNCIGGAGYTFWTNHPAFYRLQALYSIVFDPVYRETACKDGIANRLIKEIKEATDDLGTHDIDTLRLSCYFEPVQWYWELGRSMIFDNPMVIFAIIVMRFPSSLALSSMATIQYAANMIKSDFYRMRKGYNNPSVVEIMKKAQRLYRTIEDHEDKCELIPYPGLTSSPAGMKICFQEVCVTYERKFEEKTIAALQDVSFNIDPGQLVVLVGENGSGKSTLLKLLPQVTKPSSGCVYIDGHPTKEYDLNQLRNSMAILSQDEKLLPLSLRENMLFGLPEAAWKCDSKQSLDDLIRHAASLGGSQNIMDHVGWETVLSPIGVVRQSTEGVGNGNVEKAAYDELDRCAISLRPHHISGGETQRIIATRTLTRILNSSANVKLVVVDEPSSALDPISERALFSHFVRARKGRTVILVTHRFRHLVEHADLILCMKKGQLVEKGTHAELVHKADGVYAKLYNAETQGVAE